VTVLDGLCVTLAAVMGDNEPVFVTDGVLLAIRVLEIDAVLLAKRVIEGELLAIRDSDTDTEIERDNDGEAGLDAEDERLDPYDIETERDGIRDIVGDAETLFD